jgi:uncharacterized protein (DUF1778 family)
MDRKSETLNLRVTADFKELVRQAAEREHRSISNLIEVLVQDHCRRAGLEPRRGESVRQSTARRPGGR